MNTRWNKIYENNIVLDKIYQEKYKDTEDFYKKNAIELLVELGEFVNETKCFKYWTIKPVDKEKMLDELADCITMDMVFFNILNIDFTIERTNTCDNVLDVVNDTFYLATKLTNKCEEKTVKGIISNLFRIAELLDVTEEEILDAIENKHKIVLDRLNSDY